MRKIAPAFILTTLVALSSGSALALGDMNKNKKAPSATTTADAVAPADRSYSAPATSTGNAATAGESGKVGNAVSASPVAAPMGSTSSSVNSSGTLSSSIDPISSATAAADKRKSGAKDCIGLAMSDPLYKEHNCSAMKGGSGGG